MPKEFYRRRLPHWHPLGKALFVTWRLHGSLPAGRAFPTPDEAAFIAFDRLLDQMATGPRFLQETVIAQIVADELQRIEGVKVASWVIMPNHVHLLAHPLDDSAIDWPKRLGLIKGRSARQANLILARTGQRFWQEESYDHWIRNDAEFRSTQNYIERNPVTAGLAEIPSQYRWSSATASSADLKVRAG